jgi:hypothetical protein
VQLFHSGQPWDNHSNLTTALPGICKKTDKPAAGLVKDLKQRGLLDSTIVHWGGEIGRLPVTQNQGKPEQAAAITTVRVSASGWQVAESKADLPTEKPTNSDTAPSKTSSPRTTSRRR